MKKKYKQITLTGINDNTVIIPIKNILYVSSYGKKSFIHFKVDKPNLEVQEEWIGIQQLLNNNL